MSRLVRELRQVVKRKSVRHPEQRVNITNKLKVKDQNVTLSHVVSHMYYI